MNKAPPNAAWMAALDGYAIDLPTSVIEGRVVRGGVDGIGRAFELRAVRSGVVMSQTFSDWAGRFELQLPAGVYELNVLANDELLKTMPLRVLPGYHSLEVQLGTPARA